MIAEGLKERKNTQNKPPSTPLEEMGKR